MSQPPSSVRSAPGPAAARPIDRVVAFLLWILLILGCALVGFFSVFAGLNSDGCPAAAALCGKHGDALLLGGTGVFWLLLVVVAVGTLVGIVRAVGKGRAAWYIPMVGALAVALSGAAFIGYVGAISAGL